MSADESYILGYRDGGEITLPYIPSMLTPPMFWEADYLEGVTDAEMERRHRCSSVRAHRLGLHMW